MRVLYVAPELTARATNAAQVRAHALLPALERMTDLRVVAYSVEGDEEAYKGLLPADRIQVVSRRRMSVAALVLATLKRAPRAFLRFDTPQARATLGEVLCDHRPEIVHLDSFATLGLMKLIRTVHPECRIVAHIHDAQSARMEPYTRVGSFLNRTQIRVEQKKALHFETRHLGMADLTLVDSDEDSEYLRARIGRDTVGTLPLGYDPASFRPEGVKADLTQPTIVYSGSMKARQSADAALFLAREVMPRVWEQQPEAHLYIVGGGPTAEVRALGAERVHVTGFVDDMAAHLRSSAVYACPLRLGSGMRTRVVEALACGATLVTTPMGVRGLRVHEGSPPWVTVETAADFATEIIRVLDGAYPELGARAAAYARQSYSWNSVASQLVEKYSELLGDGE